MNYLKRPNSLDLHQDFTVSLDTIEDTHHFAKLVAKQIFEGCVLCLVGEMGAGKTTFTQFLLNELGVKDDVLSPTFSIMNTYEVGQVEDLSGETTQLSINSINHFDLYRIESEIELENIGFDTFVYSKAVSIIEWADKFKTFMPKKAIWLQFTIKDNQRLVKRI